MGCALTLHLLSVYSGQHPKRPAVTQHAVRCTDVDNAPTGETFERPAFVGYSQQVYLCHILFYTPRQALLIVSLRLISRACFNTLTGEDLGILRLFK